MRETMNAQRSTRNAQRILLGDVCGLGQSFTTGVLRP